MAVLFTLLFTVLLACTNSEETKSGHVAGISKNNAALPSSVNSRFFDLGGLGLGGLGGFINNIFPGINLGNPSGSGNYPSGVNFPGNSQFYPNSPIQTTSPPVSSGQGGTWPVIDDASQFPNQGTQRPQYPGQGNGAGMTQYPTQGNNWGYPQNPQENYGATQYPQYPNQGGGGYPYQGGVTQYPNQGGITQYPNQAGMTQYPNQGGITQYPNQGGMNQYPNQGGMTQYPNQGGMSQYPNQGGMSQYPNQGNYMNPQDQYPIQTPSYPIDNGGNTMPNQFPNQGSTWNQNPNTGAGQGGGTLDSIVPPVNEPDVTETPPFQNPAGGNAVLGNPVVVPPETKEPGSITYPSSTESPSRKQCVQDCQTTTEYNPVCGSDNITYINPGKFVCARNCGMNVFVAQQGRCPNDSLPFS